jgi:4-carboxymuconolactone decarboxylase
MARVTYLSKDQLPAASTETFEAIARPRGGRVPRLFQAFLHSPELAGRIAHVGAYARNEARVPADARETAILAAMREIGCQYEFTHHVPAARAAGVRDLVIDGINNRNTKGMIPKESVFVDYAKQVVNRRVNDPTYQAVEHLLGTAGAVELTLIIGYYLMIGQAMLALGVELEEGVAPLLLESPGPTTARGG